MRVGVVGTGEMGLAIAGHILDKGNEVSAFDVNADRLAAAKARGISVKSDLADLAKSADLFLLVVATDKQVVDVCEELAKTAEKDSVIAVVATISPETMQMLGPKMKEKGLRLIDAPVVYGAAGAREGTLLSLCGGEEEDIERIRPALMCYGRGALRVGPLGAGQIAKTCNNLLHWVHCVANYETLLIAKRFGLDAQRMREILLQCPASNVTLARWDTTRFTWQEKDMDVTLDLAQKAGLILPLTGQVDQLVKALKADDVKGLLYGEEASYLGKVVRPLSPAEGGLA